MSLRAPLLTLCLASCAAAQPAPAPREIVLDPKDAPEVARRIFENEARSRVDLLTFWNQNEDFPSLGIGHFIWYVPSRRCVPGSDLNCFVETFPHLLDYIEPRTPAGATFPSWLQGSPRPGCLWNDRAAFYADFNGSRLTELRAFLARPDIMSLQAQFIANRLTDSLAKIRAAAPPGERQLVEDRLFAVAATFQGIYALADYVNFKGEGTTPSECKNYQDVCWGLLQALQNMRPAAPGADSVEAFADGAYIALKRRVCHAPPARRSVEEGFLRGWQTHRLNTYRARPATAPESPLDCSRYP